MIGPVTILVNNAGIVHGRQIIDTSEDEVVQTINVNAMAYFWVSGKFSYKPSMSMQWLISG
jgi:short-subunit dehydrogenase